MAGTDSALTRIKVSGRSISSDESDRSVRFPYNFHSSGNRRERKVEMIRFRCGSCGHRLAIQKRQLAKVPLCPDCGQTTHPIAEQIIQRRRSIGPATTGRTPLNSCANCGHAIGKLQKLQLWNNHVVCTECHGKLSHENAAPAPRNSRGLTPVTVRRLRGTAGSGDDQTLFRSDFHSFRGGLVGALASLCVAGAALYGSLNLLRDAAGLISGLAIGGLIILGIYFLLRLFAAPNNSSEQPRNAGTLPESRALQRWR